MKFIEKFEPDLLNKLSPSKIYVDSGRENRYYLDKFMIRLPHEHDVKPNITIREIKQKYQRRFERLREQCHQSKHVVFVRAVAERCYDLPPETALEYSSEILHYADSVLHGICGGGHFSLLLLSNNSTFFSQDSMHVHHPRVLTAHLPVPFENGFFTLFKNMPQKDDAFDIHRKMFSPMKDVASSSEVSEILKQPAFHSAHHLKSLN
jgi:hypothetical protein